MDSRAYNYRIDIRYGDVKWASVIVPDRTTMVNAQQMAVILRGRLTDVGFSVNLVRITVATEEAIGF